MTFALTNVWSHGAWVTPSHGHLALFGTFGMLGIAVKAIGAPVNITGRPGMPDAAAFERMGVARITIASAPALVAMSAIQRLATELRASRSFDILAAPLRHPDAQKLFQRKG